MSLPWYVTGAARPDYAKYKGYKKDEAQTRKAVQQARTSSLPKSTWSPPATPAAAPSTFRPEWSAAPTWPTQERVVAQPAPAPSTRPGIVESVWNAIVGLGGEPGRSDDLSRARDAQAKQDVVEQMWDDIYARRRAETTAPFGITFDATKIDPIRREPGVNIAGFRVDRARANDAASARLTAAADAYDRQQARAEEGEGRAEETRKRRNRKENVVQITLDEWNAMTPAQQNAVRFNTDLVAAVQRDRANQKQYDPTMSERAAYDATLMDVFGTTASSAPGGLEYAPETVGLLKNLDVLPAQELGTLDDFLKLDVAITAKQVAQIEKQLQPTGPEHLVGRNELTPAQERLQRAQALTRAQGQITSRLEGELERGRRLLSDMTTEANTAAAAEFGAIVQNEQDVMGSLAENEATAVNSVTRYLADPRNDISGESTQSIMEGIAAFDPSFDENSQRKIYAAIVEAARTGSTGGAWFDAEGDTGVRWRTPQQVAGALGLPMQKVG